jgi:hypothetical protein
MIWHGKAVNHIPKCNPGSQPFWFERPALGLNLDATIEKTYTREPSLKQLAFWLTRDLEAKSPKCSTSTSHRNYR